MTIGTVVIGVGRVGQRRARVAHIHPGSRLVGVADLDGARAQAVAAELGCEWTTRWQDLVARPDVQAVVVSTVNGALAAVTMGATAAGKHVLCEKPLGRSVSEAQHMVWSAERARVILKTGLNHRYHPALWRAHQLASEGAIGELMWIRACYGHGGRAGYEREWRANPTLSGGGELLDQGVHLVDLCRWFLGELEEASGWVATCAWPMPVEDNAFALLRSARGQVAMLHTSWTRWKNTFCFEVFGRQGYLVVEGLGGSYGAERLTIGRRAPEGGPPSEEQVEFAGPDLSWEAEWEDFLAAIANGHPPLGSGHDGLRAMRLLEAVYRSSAAGRVVRL